MILASPDQRYTLALEPETESYSKWWRISCTSDDENWYAQFGGNTPVEILAGFTDALLSAPPETAPRRVADPHRTRLDPRTGRARP
ncbi:DUF317 domain-containing protein [Streptomyces yangpuensis]|uniref:DUF317 domain-containing protein n=1 Tax=Streptomyces yangpuensis TaxID=1648182 RepID=UPI0034337DFF